MQPPAPAAPGLFVVPRRTVCLGIALVLFCLLTATTPAQAQELAQELAQATAHPLLESLFPPGQLASTPAERQGTPRAVRIPPPARTVPMHLLPALPPDSPLRGSIRRVRIEGSEKPIALTFDLCQTAGRVTGYDGEVVELLRQHNASATFFASGAWLADHPERALQLMADPLFEIGNHGWTHRDPRALAGDTAANELLFTQAQYELLYETLTQRAEAAGMAADAIAHVPPSIRLMRFPFGFCNAAALALTAEFGLPAIQWDIVSGDPDPHANPERMAAEILRRARPGSIVIAHANGNNHGTAAMLRRVLPGLTQRGFRFVTMSALLAQGTPEAAGGCYGERPGDYDGNLGK
ncbi:polysaccharide deacetylase family protein [Megalodesulfovibrio gigas]|nr:polysaccharide deacetylase family protein [Megalodesulfovibrio gigas]